MSLSVIDAQKNDINGTNLRSMRTSAMIYAGACARKVDFEDERLHILNKVHGKLAYRDEQQFQLTGGH